MMRKRSLKVAVLAAMAGTLLQFGCVGNGFFRLVAANLVADQVSTFIPDLSDMFGGGGGGDGG